MGILFEIVVQQLQEQGIEVSPEGAHNRNAAIPGEAAANSDEREAEQSSIRVDG